MIDLYTFSIVIFFLILLFALWLKRKKIKHKFFIFYKIETKKGINLLDSVVKVSPRLWRIFGTCAAFVALGAMAYVFYLVLYQFVLVLTGVLKIPAVKLLLPIPVAEPTSGLGFVGIPFWFWIVGVTLVIVPHELLHGIMARMENLRVKSTGLFLLLIFPGAFVNLDEKRLNKAKLLTKLRVIGAGSVANFLVALSFLALAFYLWPSFVEPGIEIVEVDNNSPAYLAGLKEGMVLKSLNGKSVEPNYFHFYQAYVASLFLGKVSEERTKSLTSYLALADQLAKLKPGDKVEVEVDGNKKVLTLAKHPKNPEVPYLGISITLGAPSNLFFSLFPFLTILILLSYVVGLINLLPIAPLDGGLLFKALADRFFPAYSKEATSILSAILINLLLLSALLPLLKAV